ncbi:hypothetical protein K488DRAFT_89748 [Vararia minispora EC-137]|uniref:Uncharacterized protein n=1 Tax=Vararia minispora EC-137 TaxID=1314806 RepID=A0ACB8Q9G7_9AGAM|nr:hypothetical protein K488DRAFT_89748 [Vararia minispora EC-137]
MSDHGHGSGQGVDPSYQPSDSPENHSTGEDQPTNQPAMPTRSVTSPAANVAALSPSTTSPLPKSPDPGPPHGAVPGFFFNSQFFSALAPPPSSSSPPLHSVNPPSLSVHPVTLSSGVVSLPAFLDTGATDLVTNVLSDYVHYSPFPTPRSINGVAGSIEALGTGTIHLSTGMSNSPLLVCDVLYAPASSVRLISILKLCREHNLLSHFGGDTCWFTNRHTGATVIRGAIWNDRLYTIAQGDDPARVLAVSTRPAYGTLWCC